MVPRALNLMPQADRLPGLDEEGHATRPFTRAERKSNRRPGSSSALDRQGGFADLLWLRSALRPLVV